MASRPNIVPQQARGEVAGGGGAKQHNKKAGAAADVRNRRALGDIGNFVTIRGNEGKPQTQITRPITRSFCAQLLANAQAAAAAEKKQGCVNVDKATLLHDGIPVGGKKVVVPKPAAVVHKKVTIKSQSPEVIEISPDTEPVPEENKVSKIEKVVLVNKKKEGGDVSAAKKKSHTLTSVLTARSKAACGVANNKSNKHIVDIDAADANNDLAGVEYVEDIYKFYKLVENECRPHSYMHSQTEINEKMRAILIDWLTDVHQKFELSPETLYLTINIIDRFLSVKIVPRRELQLVGMGAMLIASKYEEIWAPEVNDLVCIADRAYAHTQILSMEKTILGKLEWNLTVPTHYVFLVRFIKASIADEEVSKQQQMENMVYFLADLGMMHYDTIMFCPSMVAASAVYAARCTLNKSPAWTDTLKLHTGFGEKQLMDCAKLLVFFHSKAAESKLQVVFRKYSNPLRGAVALFPPAKRLLSGDASK